MKRHAGYTLMELIIGLLGVLMLLGIGLMLWAFFHFASKW